VGRGAADTGAAAGQVHGFARSLSTEGNLLKLEVAKFLTTVWAA
jgi:methyl-accepting chemotaxis protein